jgi:hypothetical protein
MITKFATAAVIALHFHPAPAFAQGSGSIEIYDIFAHDRKKMEPDWNQLKHGRWDA